MNISCGIYDSNDGKKDEQCTESILSLRNNYVWLSFTALVKIVIRRGISKKNENYFTVNVFCVTKMIASSV